MDSITLEKYQQLLDHYENKYTDFDLFFQNYEGLFVFSRLDIVFNVLKTLLEMNIININQKFIETGSGDGRIVALASIIGFEVYGIELSNDMANISIGHIQKLVEKKILIHTPKIIQGDFLKQETYDKLKCPFQDIDIFFNYYTSTELLVSKVIKRAKIGAILISVSLSKRPVKTNLQIIYSTDLPDLNHYLYVYKKNLIN